MKSKFLFLLLVFLITCLLNLGFAQSKRKPIHLKHSKQLSRIKASGKWFVDDTGRVILFRGINAVKKSIPWLPTDGHLDLTNMTQLRNLKKWGFNVVRLGVMWTGLMPENNKMNQTYLDAIVSIVNSLAAHDMHVIIDLHQDMMSSRFASYDGVPLWIMNELPDSKFQFPWPLKNQTLNISLFAAYITESCGFAFQCLYRNLGNFGDYFQQYWSIIAKKFTNNTAILGYELINEPWAGDVYANPLLLLPGFSGRLNLMPLYDRTYDTIRRYDDETLVFYEPVTWGVMINRNYFGTGFSRPPGNDPNRTVLSWHYYCWLLNFNPNPLKNGTYSLFQKILCDNIQLKASFEAVKLDMMQLGNGPSFLTEFGVCAFPIDNKTDSRLFNTEECESILNANDKYLQSWAYWDSDFYYNVTDDVNYQLVNIFSRVYPMKTNGVPNLLYFNTSSKDFVYVYEIDATDLRKASILPTEIFVPEHVYPFGFDVSVSNHLEWSYDKQSNKVLVVLSEAAKHELESNMDLLEHIKYSKVVIYSLINISF
jgi:endoglycosylceramidase